MEESFQFNCQMCGSAFEADPDAMISLSVASYLSDNASVQLIGNSLLQWEGTDLIAGNNLAKKMKLDNLVILQIPAPFELSNDAICVCKKCRPKFF